MKKIDISKNFKKTWTICTVLLGICLTLFIVLGIYRDVFFIFAYGAIAVYMFFIFVAGGIEVRKHFSGKSKEDIKKMYTENDD